MAPSKAGSDTYNYTVAPHLEAKFDIPMEKFEAAHPEINNFIVGGFVFTNRPVDDLPFSSSATAYETTSSNTASGLLPLVLILQRAATDSHGGRFDFPGGSAEPTDATLLDGVAREVLEETGFHVSHFRELVRVDNWEKVYPEKGLMRAAKFSFVVDVHEAEKPGWEDSVELAEAEHSFWAWATREEIDKSVQLWRDGKQDDARYTFIGVQGETAAEAWKVYSDLTT
jgi:8-oxo-dGTP pyrophosphatase MutT (NUDIX family)